MCAKINTFVRSRNFHIATCKKYASSRYGIATASFEGLCLIKLFVETARSILLVRPLKRVSKPM